MALSSSVLLVTWQADSLVSLLGATGQTRRLAIVGPIVGQNAGARRYDRVREAQVRALQFVALAVLAAWLPWLPWVRNTLGILPFVWAGSVLGGAAGVLVGQALGGLLFGLLFGVLGTWLCHRLLAGYASGKLDGEGHRLPALERARPDAPFGSPRG